MRKQAVPIHMVEEIEKQDVKTNLAIVRTLEAEKRTQLAVLRTGIGVLTIPMSLLTILIATSDYYDITEVFGFVVALVIGIIGLSAVGSFLVARALLHLRHTEHLKEDSCISTDQLLQGFIQEEV